MLSTYRLCWQVDISDILVNVFSDIDGEPINLDDSICVQILSAAEALPYVELGDGAVPAGTSSYDVDVDTSTPDHMTSSSDPDVVQVSHLKSVVVCWRLCIFIVVFVAGALLAH